MITADALDVILRVQNLAAFKAGMTEGAASVRSVGAAAKESTAATDAQAASMNKSIGVMGLARKAAMGLTMAVAGLTFEAVKMGVAFDKQVTMIHTQAGASVAETARMRKEILGLNDAIASPEKLAEAAKFIESVGQRGKQAYDTLHAASTGAAVGNADVVETAKTLAGIMKVGIPGAFRTANGVMSQVNATVGSGAMTLEDYNHAMGVGVLPVAKEYGLTFQDINGALAIFTDEHMQGSSAMAQLSTSLHFLTGATKTGEAALKKIGLTGVQMAQDMHGPRGLQTALADLKAHLESFSSDPVRQNQILQQLLPGGRGRILQVLMNQLDNYGQKMDQQAKTTKNYAAAVAAYHQTAAYKISHAWQQVQVDLIHFWDQIKVEAVPILLLLAHTVGLVAGNLHALLSIVLPLVAAWIAYKVALIVAGGAQKAMALVEFITLLGEAAAATDILTASSIALGIAFESNPVGWIATAVAALIAVLVLLVMNWKTVKNAAVDAFNWILHAGEDVVHWIQQHWAFALLMAPFLAPVILIISHLNLIKQVATDVANWIGHVFSQMGGVLKGVWGGVVGFFTGAINGIIKAINFLINAYNSIPGIFRPTGKIHDIGLIGAKSDHRPGAPSPPPTGPPPRGGVFPALHAPGPALAAAYDRPFHVTTQVVLDRRVVAESVNKYNADKKARN